MAATLKTREELATWAMIELKKLAHEGYYGQIITHIQDGKVVHIETRQTKKPPVDSDKA